MKYRCHLKRLIDGSWQARCAGSFVGDVVVVKPSREEALDVMRRELRYRTEFCPCSAVADDFVELDLVEQAPTRWRGTVF